jgi:glutaminase
MTAIEKNNIEKHLEKIYNTLKNSKDGKNADYIPELKKVNPNLYAISIFTVNGDDYSIGDYNKEFAIESCSKVFTLSLALEWRKRYTNDCHSRCHGHWNCFSPFK